FSAGPVIRWEAVNRAAARASIDFDVRTDSVFNAVGTLSGGNQQKVIIAREMSRDTQLLIAAQPTRGIDVGSIEYIHRRIAEARDEGDGVLIVSSELDEILALSDRIVVMFRGRIVAEFDGNDPHISKKAIGLAMAGATA
ncbi:MAG: heme ABC transporter ATP-binding protein, partial [Rhodobacteraceae bacterium]|nr:heme ABC transporter ATP-binding protein [Paracoccaceae bacterium]